METNCNSPPEPPNDGSANPSGTPPPPDQIPKAADLQPGIDPEARDRIVAGLIAMSKPGATTTRRLPDGRTITTKVTRRHALRAMELAAQLASMNREQKKDDHQAKLHDNKGLTLNDFVTLDVPIAGDRMHEEAMRQGLSCAAELPDETIQAISAQASKDYEDENGPLPEPGPKPLKQTPPKQRQDWTIPLSGHCLILARLQDMTDPQGQEYQLMRDRERLRAVRVLTRFGRLLAAQARWDHQLETGEQPVDWDQAHLDIQRRMKDRLAERRAEDEEWERREQERQGAE